MIDLSGAVKELVENALDAGATFIDIRLREYGSELLEVSDNGRGIPVSEYAGVTKKSWTSKISSFEDVYRVQSFGFRGEVCNVLFIFTLRDELKPLTPYPDFTRLSRLFVSSHPVSKLRRGPLQIQWPSICATTMTVPLSRNVQLPDRSAQQSLFQVFLLRSLCAIGSSSALFASNTRLLSIC